MSMKLFQLKAISRAGNKRADGSYAAFERELGIFGSVEKAERFMKLVIDREGGYAEFHCFVIYEKILDRGWSEKSGTVCEFESVRSYLADGSLYCDSPYDDAGEKPFLGRPAETIKLEVGDLAWCWRRDCIYPCLVSELPLTDVLYRQWAGTELDHSDDCYLVHTCDTGHEHPECWRCLPYYGKISKRVLDRLRASEKETEEKP